MICVCYEVVGVSCLDIGLQILTLPSVLCRVVTEGQAYPLEEIASRFEDNTIAFLKQLNELHMQSRYTWGARISHLLLHLDFLGRRDVDE